MIPLLDWPAPAQRPKCFKTCATENWNCFKISRIWRNSHLSDMLFSQKLQWVLLLQDCFNIQNCDPMLMTKDIASDNGHFEVFPKEKRKILHYAFGHTFLIWSCFVTFCHASPDSFPTFWGQKLKFTIHCHYSPFTIHDTVHSEIFLI